MSGIAEVEKDTSGRAFNLGAVYRRDKKSMGKKVPKIPLYVNSFEDVKPFQTSKLLSKQ